MKSGDGALVGILAPGGLLAGCGSDDINSNCALVDGQVEYVDVETFASEAGYVFNYEIKATTGSASYQK